MRRLWVWLVLAVSSSVWAQDAWFESFKQTASPTQLYQFLYAMPKGGDLHNHLSGSARSEWWYDLAVDEQANGGYTFYTKVKINNCKVGANNFGGAPYLLLFVNLQASNYQQLPDCEKAEYKRITDLTPAEKQAWLDSIRLDKAHEGRDEFFQTHWQRLNDLTGSPEIMTALMVRNMRAFGAEGLRYIEYQHGVLGYTKPDGSLIPPQDVAAAFRARLKQPDAKATGVEVKLQLSILRFIPQAEDVMRFAYEFVAHNRDTYVGVNMVGREDNDKGYPARFLPVLRELRRDLPAVNLAFHGGEVDEPNSHVRDTLLLGAKRIGHGLNLITDDDTMLLMQSGRYLVEINLVSNLLLEYVSDYSQHPFPEYLRTGIPVALSTDDRGMWDSNMTDEYYTAVTEFNLSWQEMVSLGRNSLQYSFAPEPLKSEMLADFERAIASFGNTAKRDPLKLIKNSQAVTYSHGCRRFELCDLVE